MAETITNVTIYGTDTNVGAMTGENVTNDAQSVANVETKEQNASSPNKDENSPEKSGNPSQGLSPYSRGNGSTTTTAVSKANQNVKHVCSIPEIVQSAIFKAGATGGKIVKAIRDAIKAVLEFFGVSPSSSGIVQYLKKIISDIKDGIKWLQDNITYMQGFIEIVNTIKSAISFILSLPAKILVYFKDCLSLMYSALKAGYLDAIGADTTMESAEIQELQKTYGELKAETTKLAETANKTLTEAQKTTSSITDISNMGSSQTPENWQQSVDALNKSTDQYYSDNGITSSKNTQMELA